tara:strand:- start:154 stop:609 length:456 start_codon:yes stop_codon:yes gene_type:complete
MLKLFRKFTRNVRNYLIWLWEQEGSPGERARGLALGVFSGCFPLFGLQIFLAISLSSFCKGNRLLSATGTLISNPMTYLPLYWLNYQLGSFLLGRVLDESYFLQGSPREFWSKGADFGYRLLLGSTFMGVFLGSLIGLFAYSFLIHFKRRK